MARVIEKGTKADIDKLERLYGDLIDYLNCHTNFPGWKKDIYPARDTAELGIEEGNLYVVRSNDINDEIIGTVILRNEPQAAYSKADWHVDLDYNEILVIYTFAIDPHYLRNGVGKELMDFIIDYGKKNRMKAIRLDVYDKNKPAINFYKSNGFQYIDTIDLGYGQYGLDYFELYQLIL